PWGWLTVGDFTSSEEGVICPRCGTLNHKGASFCKNCGEPLRFIYESKEFDELISGLLRKAEFKFIKERFREMEREIKDLEFRFKLGDITQRKLAERLEEIASEFDRLKSEKEKIKNLRIGLDESIENYILLKKKRDVLKKTYKSKNMSKKVFKRLKDEIEEKMKVEREKLERFLKNYKRVKKEIEEKLDKIRFDEAFLYASREMGEEYEMGNELSNLSKEKFIYKTALRLIEDYKRKLKGLL
ncbi:MAG: hypothetical protein J7L50_00795, partial [Candidatus Odinarchaeota archaeon]|nr:hypothetical protein [Candidatus Odinarchaeota archaeon]